MKPELIVIDLDDEIKLNELYEYLEPFEYVAFDTETTGVTKHDSVIGFSVCAEETKAFYVTLAKWNTEIKKLEFSGLTDTYVVVRGIVQRLATKKLIMHNGVFDCTMVEYALKERLIDSLHTDTMILAHLLNENRRVGLKELGATLFGDDVKAEQKAMKDSVVKNGGKLTKDCYEMYKADSFLMGMYGAKDALLTYKLFTHLVPDLYAQGLDKFFYEEESMPMLRGPTYDLNTTGLHIDTNRLTTLKKTLEAECEEAKAFIHKEIKSRVESKYPGTSKTNQFNIGASQQLAWLLFGEYNLEFSTLTKAGKTVCAYLGLRLPYTASAKRDFIARCTNRKGEEFAPKKKIRDPWAYVACDKEALTKLAPKYKWIEKLLEYQKKMKLLSTYVEGIESRINYGTIQPSFLQHGTTSGRYSSRNPNFQNLPRDDKRIKECITSRNGHVFVGADYSQLEPRIFAYFSGDKRLLEAFNGKSDFYSTIGMEVYNKYDCTPQKDGSSEAFGVKYKKLRDLSKQIALASTYGATAYKLAKITGKSVEDTQLDIDNYFERFPGVAVMMKESHKQAKEHGHVINYFGRPRRMPEAKKIDNLYGKADLPYEARNLLNLAVNHRIQSTAASIVNRAAIRLHDNCKQAGIDCKLVLQVHDSLVVECKEADAKSVAALLEDAMINTTHLEGIRFEALPKIGKNLSEV